MRDDTRRMSVKNKANFGRSARDLGGSCAKQSQFAPVSDSCRGGIGGASPTRHGRRRARRPRGADYAEQSQLAGPTPRINGGAWYAPYEDGTACAKRTQFRGQSRSGGAAWPWSDRKARAPRHEALEWAGRFGYTDVISFWAPARDTSRVGGVA